MAADPTGPDGGPRELGSRAAGGILGTATVTAALLAWLTLVLVARVGGEDTYVVVAVLWAIYYGVAGVYAGLQQEVTRSAVAAAPVGRRGVPLGLAGAAVGAGLAVVPAVALAPWPGSPTGGLAGAAALAFALLGLAGLVVVLGVLAAGAAWRLMAVVVLADATIRLAVLVAVAAVDPSRPVVMVVIGGAGYSWLLVLPWVARRGPARAAAALPVDRQRFARLALGAMAATGFASVLVGGFPWLLSITSGDDVGAEHAGLLAALVLFRSPVLVVVNGVRPVLLRSFLAAPAEVAATVWRVWARAALAGAVVVAVAAALGPWLLRLTFGEDFRLSAAMTATLVASALLLALGTVSSLALISVARHRRATEGWAAAAVVTVLALLVPGSVATRVATATLAGPLVAVVWHALALRAAPGSAQSSPSENADSRSWRE